VCFSHRCHAPAHTQVSIGLEPRTFVRFWHLSSGWFARLANIELGRTKVDAAMLFLFTLLLIAAIAVCVWKKITIGG
jgi:hypothetical protein